ncbi:alpha/beta hydrolase [Amycolatopsis speibonae]|uniref:Alpha/beta hydrolase n=1 Tax=Amycolatopsis speibonae TaxID=1450224 RepID=A0ABV7PED7_9PSEU
MTERRFVLGDIPGVLWLPEDPGGQVPLVLLAHGGGQHTRSPGLLAQARHLAGDHGFAVAAIDAPGHGDRRRPGLIDALAAVLRESAVTGEPPGPGIAQVNAGLAAQAVHDWRATLDALPSLGWAGGPVGFWGLSLGSSIGVPLTAAEPRITAAVLGLAGREALAEAARRVTVPVRFLVQWHDRLLPRESALALFDAFASLEKSLHANPGDHHEVPESEVDSAARFLARHLRRSA